MKLMQNATKRLYGLFSQRITAFEEGIEQNSMAVAFSGGPDSTALAFISSLYSKLNSHTFNHTQIDPVDSNNAESGRNCRKNWPLESNVISTDVSYELSDLEWRPLHLKMLNYLQNRNQASESSYSDRCFASQRKILALIVDHGLRPESKMEAYQAKIVAEKLGLVPFILTIDWKGLGITQLKKQNQMEQCRNERYRLLVQKCIEEEVKVLLVAHHADDEVEGFLMRLLRGSGIDGLSGMEAISIHQLQQNQTNEIVICRPFLGVRKNELIECLQENDIPWIEDSSNFDDSYFRVQIRNFLRTLEIQSSTDYNAFFNDVLRVIQACQRIRVEQESRTLCLLKTALLEHKMTPSNAHIDLDTAVMLSGDERVIKRLLVALVRILRPSSYPPSGRSIDALVHAVSSGTLSRSYQVGGCLFRELKPLNNSKRILRVAPQNSTVKTKL
eukprot:g3697.t1